MKQLDVTMLRLVKKSKDAFLSILGMTLLCAFS